MAHVCLYDENRTVDGTGLRFDSDSFLGLDHHPRIIESVERALAEAGRHSGKGQPPDGAGRWLRELEETVSAFHEREDTIVFPSARAAEEGAIGALLGSGDFVACDSFSAGDLDHACRLAETRRQSYAHLDLAALDHVLEAERALGARRLVVSDGVFGVHGHVAPLPGLRKIASRHGAKLLVREAYSLGVLGETGRGLEEHHALPGTIDVLVGSFGTAASSSGGYVSGSAELVGQIRASLDPAAPSLSAPACAAVKEAFRVMQEEPEHRLRLWRNARHLWSRLNEAALPVPPRFSPILPVFVGDEHLLSAIARALVERGVVCGAVRHPAVGRGDAILRLTASARHATEELDRAARVLVDVARRFGILRCQSARQRNTGVHLRPATAHASA